VKIAGGINEGQLAQQAEEISEVNDRVKNVRVLRSIELNLSPIGTGDMDELALHGLDLVLGCFPVNVSWSSGQTFAACTATKFWRSVRVPR
jgi:histidinol phosphatase-like PHP family hydrolase